MLNDAEQLQATAHNVQDVTDGHADVEFDGFPEALGLVVGHFLQITLSDLAHDGAPGEHFFFVDNGVALGAGGNQRLTVGHLDGHSGAVTPGLDQ